MPLSTARRKTSSAEAFGSDARELGDGLGRPRQDGCPRAGAGNQIAVGVADTHPIELDPEPAGDLLRHVVSAGDELGPSLDQAAVRQPLRPDAAADPLAGLHHDDLDSGGSDRLGRGESGEPGSNHCYPAVRL